MTEAGRKPKTAGWGAGLRSLTTLSVLLAIGLGFYVAVFLQARATGGNPHLFIHPANLANMVGQAAMVGVLACGMTLVIVSGNIDLSVGSMLGMLGAVAAFLMSAERGPGWAPLAAAGFVLCIGGLLGASQGWLVGWLRVPAFVVTLGGLLAYRGVLLLVAKSTIPVRAEAVIWLGTGRLTPPWAWGLAGGGLAVFALGLWRRRCGQRRAELPLGGLRWDVLWLGGTAAGVSVVVAWLNRGGGLPVRFVAMVLLACTVGVIARRLRFGRHVYAIGGNVEAAVYSGINVKWHIVGVFALMGMVAGFAGLVTIGVQMAADPGAGDLMELYAIAACVIGGTSLSGGRGTVAGSILGALIMATIRNGLSCLGVASAGEKIVLGVILVAAVGIDYALSGKRT